MLRSVSHTQGMCLVGLMHYTITLSAPSQSFSVPVCTIDAWVEVNFTAGHQTMSDKYRYLFSRKLKSINILSYGFKRVLFGCDSHKINYALSFVSQLTKIRLSLVVSTLAVHFWHFLWSCKIQLVVCFSHTHMIEWFQELHPQYAT